MLKERYCHMMNQCVPGEALIQQTAAGRRGKRRLPRWGLTAAAAVLACALLAPPVLAATVPAFRQALYEVAPATAQYFSPVQQSCEDNGIRMEVVASYIHGDTAALYVSMQDLTGDRIDETTDLFDSYDILRPYDSAASCQMVSYEEESRTATFLITITQWNGRPIEGSKITFQVREFLSHKETYEDLVLPLSLQDVGEAPAGPVVNQTGGSGTAAMGETPQVLTPGTPWEEFPVKEINFTGIGYVDGQLHVQLAVADALENDNHGWLYLKDAAGEEVSCSATVSFCNHSEAEGRVDYQEFIFDVPQECIGDYTLYGGFTTSGLLTKGNWSVTFPLTDMTH